MGHPGLPIRRLVGLLILKQLEKLSGERVVLDYKRNPYYQYYCNASAFEQALISILPAETMIMEMLK
jgi:IS5 family transposase